MEQQERLDLYLRNALPPAEAERLEEELLTDMDLRQTLENLIINRRVVQLGTIQASVRQAQAQFFANRSGENDKINRQPKTVGLGERRRQSHSWGAGWLVRIAAAFAFVLLAYGGYQFATLSEQSLYRELFVNYQLTTMRGSDELPSPLEARYRAGDFAGVVRQAANLPAQHITDFFLTGMAHLKQGQYQQAIGSFERVEQSNRQRLVKLFEPETDFYLSLAYLGARQYEQAHALLARIGANQDHPYRDFVDTPTLWKLKALDWLRR